MKIKFRFAAALILFFVPMNFSGVPFFSAKAQAAAIGLDFTSGRYQSSSTKNSYQVKHKIGAGNFGNVYLGTTVNGDSKHRPVAVKFYKKNDFVSLDGMLAGFVKAKDLCPILCPLGLHEIIDVGPFVSSFKLGPVKGVVSELGVGDGKMLKPYLSLVDGASKNLVEFASRIEFASALFQYMSDFQTKLAEQNLALNDIKPANFIVSSDNRLLFADFDTLHPLGQTPKIFTLLNAAPEQFKGSSTATTDLYLVANTILEYISGSPLIEHIRNTSPSTRPQNNNPKAREQNYVFSYGLIESQDPNLERSLNPFFSKVLQSFQENVLRKSAKGDDVLELKAKQSYEQAEYLFEGIRAALKMKPEMRQHYKDSRMGSQSDTNPTKKRPTQLVSEYVSKIVTQDKNCSPGSGVQTKAIVE